MISMLLEYWVMGAYVYKLARGRYFLVVGGELLVTPCNPYKFIYIYYIILY